MPELSPEGEVLAAHIASTTAAIQVLVLCLQRNGALKPGQYQEALREYLEIAKGETGDTTLALISDIREALLD